MGSFAWILYILVTVFAVDLVRDMTSKVYVGCFITMATWSMLIARVCAQLDQREERVNRLIRAEVARLASRSDDGSNPPSPRQDQPPPLA